MEDYQRQAIVLNNQVAEMERQKIDLVQQVEDRLEEGNRANLILAKKVQEANKPKINVKNFRDFEGEMEDYEPVEEAPTSEEEEPEEPMEPLEDPSELELAEPEPVELEQIDDTVQLPVLPAYGVINKVRQIEDSQHWMQQITPRAGGLSNLGEDQFMDVEDDMELAMDQNATAHYETASIPPSAYEFVMQKGHYEAAYQDMTSQMEAAQSEEY